MSYARAEDAQGTPTQSHTPPSILVYEEIKLFMDDDEPFIPARAVYVYVRGRYGPQQETLPVLVSAYDAYGTMSTDNIGAFQAFGCLHYKDPESTNCVSTAHVCICPHEICRRDLGVRV